MSSDSDDDGNGRPYRRPRMSLRAMTTARLRDALVSSRFGDVLMNMANSTRFGNAILAATTNRLDMMSQLNTTSRDGSNFRPRSFSSPPDPAYASFVKIDKRDFSGHRRVATNMTDDDGCDPADMMMGSPSSSANTSPSTTYTLLGADDFSNAQLDDFPNFPSPDERDGASDVDEFVGQSIDDDVTGERGLFDDDNEREPRSPSPVFSSPVIIHSHRPSISSFSDDDDGNAPYLYPPHPPVSSSPGTETEIVASPVSSPDNDLAASPVNVSPFDVFFTPSDVSLPPPSSS